MKNWKTYLIFLLTGALAGIVIAVKWLQVDKIIYQIRRFKQKNSPGGRIDIEQGENANLSGESKRRQRKIDKLAKRIEKKRLKSLSQLNK